MLKGKNVLLGVTGSIAAYKSTYIVRGLKKLGASVRVIQTESSLDFVSPLVLSTLSGNQVLTEVIDKRSKEWNSHVDLGLWADYMLISPVTAKTMSKMAEGNCDNLLLASYLSAKCKVYFAPAMDLDMYKHPSTKKNIKKLESFGNKMIPATYGELASGLVGDGRMAEPDDILEFIIDDLNRKKILYGKKCLVTAGPTQEYIDPVRYISNRSSGKMGMAVAEELAENGALVDLVMGPSNLLSNHPNVNQLNVISADEMYEAVSNRFDGKHISVFTAAVSDYKPKKVFDQKMKKSVQEIKLGLERNKDIISEISSIKSKKQMVVGFALETENELENAIGKLHDKDLDIIVLNSTKDKGATFDYNTNKVTIVDKDLNIKHFGLKEKKDVAADVVSIILEKMTNQ